MHYVIESGGAVRSREFSDEGKAELRGMRGGQQMDSRVRKRAMSWGRKGRARADSGVKTAMLLGMALFSGL